jgi:hypothetical protein
VGSCQHLLRKFGALNKISGFFSTSFSKMQVKKKIAQFRSQVFKAEQRGCLIRKRFARPHFRMFFSLFFS